MRFRWRLFLLIVGLLVSGIMLQTSPHPVRAQDGESCEALVEDVFAALSDDCPRLDRNEACVIGSPATIIGEETGAVEMPPGERFDLLPVHTMRVNPLDTANSEWGVLSIGEGAGLPANTEELVTMWLFGEAELLDRRTETQRNAPPAATCYARVTTDTLNVRSYPATNIMILGALHRGDTVILTGRLSNTSWYRIDYGDAPAWVFSGYVRTNCEIIEVPVVLRDAPALTEAERYRDPFQTAALRTQPPTETCAAAPPPGLLLHPPATGQSRFTFNGVSFELTSSLYVQASAEAGLLFQAIAGPVVFSLPDGWSLEVPPGAQTRFPLSEDGLTAVGPSPGLEPLDVDSLATLPMDRLPHPIARLPRPVIEVPLDDNEVAGNLIAGDALTFFFDNRAGIVHEFELASNAYPVLSIIDPDLPVLRPYIQEGRLDLPYWTMSNRPHLIRLETGTTRSGTYQLATRTRDLRLCRPGGNSQSATLPGGEDHAGNIWFGHAGEVVTLAASGDISTSASSFPGWRLRITQMFLETPTLPPIQYELLEGHNANTVTWTVPETGYYWIEVWTTASGTTTVTSSCAGD